VLALARSELAALNQQSLADPRLTVQLADAWPAVEQAVAAGRRFDLIVVDLTTPQTIAAATFHTIEWYALLRRLLSERGLLAVNAASPTGQASAFWSIYNSQRAAGLQPRPYRVLLPSFQAQGYGPDWGFLLAATTPIAAAELDDGLSLAAPRTIIRDAAHLRRLFQLPPVSVAYRATAQPTHPGSDRLLAYLMGADWLPIDDPPGAVWDGLGDDEPPPLPAADGGHHLLPPAVQTLLRRPIGHRLDEQTLFERVMQLMPALRPYQTRAMVAAFLAEPERFLASIDLGELVGRLLRQAGRLPRRLVAELRLLRATLRRFGGDHQRLLQLGMRIVTVVTLVVIVANLLYPDAVYGKGTASGGGSSTSHASSFASPSHSAYDPRGATPDLATGGGYRTIGQRGVAVDEGGALLPARRYVYYRSYHGHRGYHGHRTGQPPAEPATQEEAPYRLTPETDILSDGRTVVSVTADSYLLLGDEVTLLTERETGQPLLYLTRDPAQLWQTVAEIERQRTGLQQSARAKETWLAWVGWLQFAHWQGDDQRELSGLQRTVGLLERARFLLGPVPSEPPAPLAAPGNGAVELIAGVWLLPDGSGLVVRQPDGLAYLDGQAWYLDSARRQRKPEPYPEGFKRVVLTLLGEQVKEQAATTARLQMELSELQTELSELRQDKTEYDQIAQRDGPQERVEYGTDELAVAEAQRRTNEAIARAERQLGLMQSRLNRLPQEVELARRTLVGLGGNR
jgi:spermidine synthase